MRKWTLIVAMLGAGAAVAEEPPDRVEVVGPVEVQQPVEVKGAVEVKPMQILRTRDGRIFLVPADQIQDAPPPLERTQPLDRPGPLDRD